MRGAYAALARETAGGMVISVYLMKIDMGITGEATGCDELVVRSDMKRLA